jgi:general secretion pathway protein D
MRGIGRKAALWSAVAAIAFAPLASLAQVVPSSGDPQGDQQQPTNAPATRISLNFRDASLDTVLDYLSEQAGFEVVKVTPVTVHITELISKQPVTPEEAVSLLNSVLNANGYTAIRMGRILKIVSLDKAKKENVPVHFGSDPEQIAQSDELITQVIPVRSVDAEKLKTDLQPLVSTDADFTANAMSNTLIMTDTSANIRRVVEIVANLDKRDAQANSIIVKQLKFADATAAAKLIEDIFAPQQQTTQNNNIPNPGLFFRAFGGGGGGGAGGGGGFGPGGFGRGGGGAGAGASAQGSQDQGQTGKVTASADTRTNTVVVSGPTDTLKVISDVLNQLDANPAEEETFFTYAVNNGQAVDMAATLNALFGGSGSTPPSTTTNQRNQYGTSTGNPVSGSRSSLGGLGGGSGIGGGGAGALGGGLGGTGGGGSYTGRNTSSSGASALGSNRGIAGIPGLAGGANGAASESGLAELVGQVYVVPDQDTNSLLVATASKYEAEVRELITKLDRPVPQVLIKVLIAEVTHDNSQDLGVDFSGLNLGTGGTLDTQTGLISAGHGQAGSSILGAAAQAAAGAGSTSAPPGMVLNVLSNNVNATIQALAQENKLDVLSRPYILTSDNQQADITVGSEVPFIDNSYIDSNGGTHNTVQYQDIGIILSVTPHINPQGDVIMEVSPQISALTGQTVTIQAGVDAPVFELRSADAYVAIHDGQTVVIGGLMQDQKTDDINSVPLLGDIPLLGKLFQYRSTSKTKTELLIFLTPHVAMSPGLLTKMSQEETDRLKLTPSAVQPGVMQDQLNGMAAGAATQPSVPLELPAPSVKPSSGGPLLPGTK